ncbi:DUF58 domain-containing protein [bacterium]|nr:DUF58 domain-containing protein [bacterium]
MIHNRVFLIIIFGLALPAAALWALFAFHVGLLAVGIYVSLGLLILAQLMTVVWLRPLVCTRELDRDVVTIGEPVNVTTRLFNPAPWPILWLYTEETVLSDSGCQGTWRRLLFLPPRRSFYLTYRIIPPRRGCHPIGPLILETGDVFGLFRRCRVEPRRDFVTVLPRYSVLTDFEAGRQPRLGNLAAARSIFEDPTLPRGVREYRRGDPLKRIHWKSSARTGALRTRLFDPVIEAGATVVLDFHKEAWAEARSFEKFSQPPAEQAVEIAATVCRFLSDGGWRVGFFSNGRDPLGLPGITLAQARAAASLGEARNVAGKRPADNRLAPIAIRPGASPDQFSIILENLGRIELSDGLTIDKLLPEELPYIPRRQALVVITGDVTDGLITALSDARGLGYRVLLLVVCNNIAHDRAFEWLVPRGVEVYRMDKEWRLNEIVIGRQYI